MHELVSMRVMPMVAYTRVAPRSGLGCRGWKARGMEFHYNVTSAMALDLWWAEDWLLRHRLMVGQIRTSNQI